MTLPADVLHEIVALHWSSDAKGATCIEVWQALAIRGVTADIEVVGRAIELLLMDGLIRSAAPLEPAPRIRDEWPVWVPSSAVSA